MRWAHTAQQESRHGYSLTQPLWGWRWAQRCDSGYGRQSENEVALSSGHGLQLCFLNLLDSYKCYSNYIKKMLFSASGEANLSIANSNTQIEKEVHCKYGTTYITEIKPAYFVKKKTETTCKWLKVCRAFQTYCTLHLYIHTTLP